MKKIFMIGAMALCGAISAQKTGNFKLGAHIGLPTGSDRYFISMNAGVDVAYLWPVSNDFKLGITSGVSFYTWTSKVKDAADDLPTPTMIPIAATAQYSFGQGPFVGFDFGYAMFTNKGAKGALLMQPKFGYTFSGVHDVYLGYKALHRDGSAGGSVNLGYAYNF